MGVPYTTGRRIPHAVWIVPAGFVILIAVLTAFAASREDDPAAFVEVDPPASYRIAYRLDTGGADARTRLLLVTVRRPFEAHVALTESDGSEVFTSLETEPAVYTLPAALSEQPGAVPIAEARPPSPPTADIRPWLVAGRAIEEGAAFAAGFAEVEGRRCTELVVGSPFGATITPDGPRARGSSAPDRTELCVDERGLVLSERRFEEGEEVFRRVALEIELDPDLPDGFFDPPRAAGPQTPEGLARVELPAAQDAAPIWLTAPPAGFEPSSAWVSEPDPDTGLSSRAVIAYGSPTGSIVLEATTFEPDWPERPAVFPVDLGTGAAQLILDPVANELRVTTASGLAVRVRATLPPADLLELWDRLVERP